MADFSNIPTGLKITTQIPLDVKGYVLNEATLAYLGVGDNLAFTYHEGLRVVCIEERKVYEWREVESGEENTGLINIDFTYPNNHIVYDIDYSNRVFNFFQIEYVSIGDIITYTGTNIGTGFEILKDITGTSTKTFNFKKINSDNLTIIDNGDDLTINTPSTASIPALYVNNLYKPSYDEWLVENKIQNAGTAVTGFVFRGKGTLAQPFTDSTVYPLAGGSSTTTPNTAIQNALDGDSGLGYIIKYSYQGNGTRLSPQRPGQKIIIQDNVTGYNFAGNFGYSRINIEINANLNSTILGYVVDMDNATHFNSLSDIANITIGNRYILYVNGNGFNNSGTNIATNTSAQTRGIVLLGSGTIFAPGTDITKYIINSDITSTGNNNDGGLTYDIRCNIRASYQGITKIGGLSRIWNFGNMQSGYSEISVNTLLKAHVLLGGQFLNFEGSAFSFGSPRTDGIIFTPTGGFTPRFICQSTRFQVLDTITNLFNKTNNNVAILNVTNSDSGVYLNITNVFESTNLWGVYFNQNIFETGNINSTKADLTNGNTTSVINSIGTNLIENLVVFPNKASALAAGHPINSTFIKRNVFNAVDLLAGVEYKVVTPGSPSLGAVGSFFTATGSETGGGTASLETREILT